MPTSSPAIWTSLCGGNGLGKLQETLSQALEARLACVGMFLGMAVKCKFCVKIPQVYRSIYISKTKRDVRGKTLMFLKSNISSIHCKRLCICSASGFYETVRQTSPVFTHDKNLPCLAHHYSGNQSSLQLLQL